MSQDDRIVVDVGNPGAPRSRGASGRCRPFGIALYVDFTATSQDWASYLTDWMAR